MWDSITFDPDLNMVYLGTGNGSPWNRKPAQPGQGGDNLYLRVDRRAQRRYRQVPVALPGNARRQLGLHVDPADDPGRHHDRRRSRARSSCMRPRTASSSSSTAPTASSSRPRTSSRSNWATGFDDERPADRGRRRAPARTSRSSDASPAPIGAHNWHPMSFNPQTGLAYLPAQNMPLNLTGRQELEAFDAKNAPGRPHAGSRAGTPASSLNVDAAQRQALRPPRSPGIR